MADPSPARPTSQLEVETVLDVDDGFGLPDLTGLPGVAEVVVGGVHDLDATYFDTGDLVLIRAGITLRRRTGGADAGWHLKLPQPAPGEGVARLELHRPLGAQTSTPPAVLLALVQSRLRGAAVGPVARLRTTRTVRFLQADGGARLAEVADDMVAAELTDVAGEVTASHWRELEVELADGAAGGGPELLAAVGEQLRAAGARPAITTSKLARALAPRLSELPGGSGPPTSGARHRSGSASGAVLDYLVDQYDVLLATDPAVRLDGPDSVHAMRVACRRLRTTLAAFRPLFTGTEGDRLRDEARWIAGLLGEARDAEVMRERLLAEIDGQPPELVAGPVRNRVDRELRRRYAEGLAGAVRGLDSARYAAFLRDLEAFVTEPPLAGGKDSTTRLVQRVAKSHARVAAVQHEAEATDDPVLHDELLHEVRKAAKRARYAAEVAHQHLPGKAERKLAKRYEKAAKAVQEVLGDHHDSVVLRDELLALAERAHRAGELTFGYGVMHADLGHERALDEEAFARAWHDLQSAAKEWPGR